MGKTRPCAEGENAVTFAFANDLNAEARLTDDGEPDVPPEPKECPSGWTGDDCKTPDQSCNGHGVFVDEPGVMTACICETGWGGNNCDVACPNDQYPLEGLDFETAQPNGSCYSCSTDSYLASGDGCSKCSNRFVVNAGGGVSMCAPCSVGMAAPATEAECSKCPNREMVNGACVISTCEDGLRNKYGDCVPCSTGAAVSVTEAECSKCPNREMLNGKCVSKCEDGFFRGDDYNCYVCSIEKSVRASAVECAKCDATDTPRKDGYFGCYRQTCDLNQFRSYGNACIPCDDPEDVYMSAMEDTECKKCGRYWVQKYGPLGGPEPSYCVRTCPTGLAPNPETHDCVPGKDYFLSRGNYLYPCSYSGSVNVASEEACAVCDTTDTPRQATQERVNGKWYWFCRLK